MDFNSVPHPVDLATRGEDGVETEEEGWGDREGRPGVGRLPQGAGGLRRADGVGGLRYVQGDPSGWLLVLAFVDIKLKVVFDYNERNFCFDANKS